MQWLSTGFLVNVASVPHKIPNGLDRKRSGVVLFSRATKGRGKRNTARVSIFSRPVELIYRDLRFVMGLSHIPQQLTWS